MKYKLVNPMIEGTLQTEFEGNSTIEAAQTAWNTISKHIYDNVPKFAFTLRDKDGKLHNFVINEVESATKNNGGKIKYKLASLGGVNKNIERAFKNKLVEVEQSRKQSGGVRHKRYNNLDEDSDEDSDEFDEDALYKAIRYKRNINLAQPIVYWWYSPTLYKEYLKNFYMPSFVQMTPYVEVELVLE